MAGDSGERAEPSSVAGRAPRGKIALLALLAVVALLGWGMLVGAAIDAGGRVRSEDPATWVPLALTTTGGAVCLFVVLLLGMRVIARGRGRGQGARRPRGGGHAAR